MTWRIVCDSSCDLAIAPIGDAVVDFDTVPLKIVVGDTEYVDDKDLDPLAMLQHMKSFKGASSSACPSPDEWARQFEQADRVIAIAMTSALSGTYNSAMVAKEMVLSQHPEKKIHVVDSCNTSGGLVLLCRKAKELIHQGLPFEEVTQQLDTYAKDAQLAFMLSHFSNLVKTGRMPKIVGALAQTLRIAAVCRRTPEGTIEIMNKCRGEAAGLKYLVEQMGKMKRMTPDLPVVITHCDNLKIALEARDQIAKAYGITDFTILTTRALTTFYAEEKGLLVAF